MNELHPTRMNVHNIELFMIFHGFSIDFRRPVSFRIIIIHEIGKFHPMVFMSARAQRIASD